MCTILASFLAVVLGRQDSEATVGFKAWKHTVIDRFLAVGGGDVLVGQLETLFCEMTGVFEDEAEKKTQFIYDMGLAAYVIELMYASLYRRGLGLQLRKRLEAISPLRCVKAMIAHGVAEGEAAD